MRSGSCLSTPRKERQVDGAARILSSSGAPKNKTILDLSAPLDLPKGASAERTFEITDHPVTLKITDTINGLKPGETIEWHMMTRAKAKPAPDGYRLSLGRESIELTLSSAQATGTSARNADPPPHDFDAANPGITRTSHLAAADKAGEIAIRAVFRQAD